MKQFFVGRPKLLNKELLMKRVSDIIDSQQWGNGGYYLQSTEEYIKEYLQCQDAILVSNATIGLELALKTQVERTFPDLDPKDIDVLIPSFTFVATAASVSRLGYNIVFGDIDEDYCLDPNELDNCQAPLVNLPVNLFGNLASNKFLRSCHVYDSAHALGVFNEEKNKYVGADCSIGVFSGHSTKLCGSGEVGFVTTNSSKIADKLRELRNFGYVTKNGDREGRLNSIGTNAKVSEIQAAMLLTQLESIQEIQEHYHDNYKEYERLIPDVLKPKNNLFSNYSYIVIEVAAAKRERIVAELATDNIFARTYFTPLHTTKPYKQKINLPMTMKKAESIICLPTGLDVSVQDVRWICSRLRRILNAQ